MARKKFSLEFPDFKGMMEELDRKGKNVEKAVSEALIESKEYINKKIKSDMAKANLPAQGKYSVGDTEEALDTEMKAYDDGAIFVNVGFDLDDNGLTSIFLMYGTPRMDKVQGLYDDIYGKETQKAIRKIQQQSIKKVLEGD